MRILNKVYNLAVPRPAMLTVAQSGTGSGDVMTTAYIYTYVTDINDAGVYEESEPSEASELVDWFPNGRVNTLNGFTMPADASRGVKWQRIYRLQTGAAGTYFKIDGMAEPCPALDYNAPSPTLEGLTAMPNGMMAAFSGKKLFFCEPYKPHAWPEKYSLSLDYEIVALGAMGMTLLVATKGQPYLVSGTRPDTMAAQKLEQNLPCIGVRTMVDLGYAVAYASNEGLVVGRADGSVSLATANIFSRHDWVALNPETMIGCQYNGRYCAFYNSFDTTMKLSKGSLLIDLSGQSFLIRSAITAQAAVYDVVESALFYVPVGGGSVRQMDAPGALSKYLYWKSKEFVLPYPENYGAFLIDGIINNEVINPDIVANQIAAIRDSNKKLMTTRKGGRLLSIGGDIHGVMADPGPAVPLRRPVKVQNETVGGENSCTMNGDYLTPLPRGTGAGNISTITGATSVSVGILADKKLVATVTDANIPVRLPSGFRARTWEFEVKTNGRIYRLTLAKNMDDLKRQP
jgi:hypothetical protein